MVTVLYSLVSFIVVLGVLVFVHEFGHFLFAKLFGVRVLKFSLGFGNRVVGKKWGDTEYLISAFPLGGYVKMYGEVQGEEEIPAEEQACSFSHKSPWQRLVIVAGGPVFNLIFAVLLFFGMYYFAGLPESVDTTVIGQVAKGSAAEKAGIKIGDLVVRINGKETTSWEKVTEYIRERGAQEVEVVLRRGDEELTIRVTPTMEKVKSIFGEEVGERYMLGITRKDEMTFKKTTLAEAWKAGFVTTWNIIILLFTLLGKIIARVVPASEQLGGPILIAEMAGQQLKAGWLNLLFFTGQLSVSLGILNLLPIPVLDGGHLVFLTIEGIRRRPLNNWVMEMSQKVGLFLLISLMIFVFYNDINRIVQRWLGT